MSEPRIPSGRILVVDDKESNRYVLATWFRRAGYDVVEAKTGGETLATLETQVVDLVVLDVNLPDMSGYDVCERIKAEARTAAVPVLHVSATATEVSDRSEGLRRGAEGYLVEPVEREELLATAEALLRAASAQRVAVRLSRRLRQLNEATLAVNEALTLERLIATIVREAGELFEAAALVAVVVEERAFASVSRPGSDPAVEHSSAAVVEELRRAAAEGTLSSTTSFAALGASSPSASYLYAPLDDSGILRGILIVEVSSAQLQSDELDVVLRQYARAASTALKNMENYDIEHRIALTLQRSLLPDVVPPIPGLEVAVRYRASTSRAEVGGDFYEIFPLGNDLVALAIGDVLGHSLEAATVMAQLRTGIRAYALEGHRPGKTLSQLNRLLRKFHPDVTATVCYGLYDRRSGRCELANAGHPAPLVASAGGTYFLPNGGALLGVDGLAAREHAFTLDSGAVLLFYTDGLVERRRETINVGLDRLARVASSPAGSLEEFCDRVLREAGPVTMIDDVALMAIRPSR